MRGVREAAAAAAGCDSWSPERKAAVVIRDDGRNSLDRDEDYYRPSSCPKSSDEIWGFGAGTRWSADDLTSLGETSSRASSSSSSKSSSSSANRKSSSRGYSSNSSRSNSSSSSRSSSGRRRSKRQISCIRTVFRIDDDEDERVGYSMEGLDARFDTDMTCSASEDEFRFSSERLFPSPLSPVTSNTRDNDRLEIERNDSLYGDGNDMFDKSRKSTWRKLRHRRLLTNLFNFKSQNGSGFSSGQEPQTMLVDIHVLRSPGPVRLLVDRNELVQHVIELALHAYECQRRQPALGRSHRPFLLYCQTPEFEAMDEKSRVGDYGARHFFLYPKSESDEELSATPASSVKRTTANSPSFISWVEKTVAEMQVWGSGLMNVLSKNIGCLASSFFGFNFDSIMYAVLKALR